MATRTTQTPPVSTKITINGREFELRNMSAAQGDALYAALGQLPGEEGVRYRQMADSVAHVAQQFNALANIELPPGLTLQNALSHYFNLLRQGSRAIESATDPWIRHMHQALSPGTARSLDVWARAASVPGNIWDGARDGSTALPQFVLDAIGALRNRMPRGVNISEDQARAFGAAYAAAMYREQNPDPAAQTPTPAPAVPGVKVRILDNITTGLEYGWMQLSHAVPLIPQVIRAVFNWFGAIPDSWSISAAWRKAGQELETAQRAELAAYGGRMPSFSELLANNHRISTETPRHADAQATLRAAGTVAGISTDPLVRALEGNEPLWNREGHLATITRNPVGLFEAQPVNRPDGTPVTHENSAPARTYGLPESGRDTEYKLAYGAAAAAGTAAGTYGVLRYGPRALEAGIDAARATGGGVIRATTGVASGLLQGWAGLAGGREVARSLGDLNKMDRLIAQEAADAQRLAGLQAQTTPTPREQRTIQRLERSLGDTTSPAPNSLRGKIETLDTRINSAPPPSGTPRQSAGIRIADIATDLDTAGSTVTARVAGTTAADAAVGASRLGRASRAIGRLFGRVATPVGVGMSAWDVADGLNTGNTRNVVTGTTELGTVGAGAAIGAGIGVWFGGIGAIPGAIIGTGVGGIASLATGWGAGAIYDANTRTTRPVPSAPTPPPTRDVSAQSGSAGTPDAGLAAAAVDAHARAQEQARIVVTEPITTLGAVITNGDSTLPTRPAALPIPPVAERGMSELITF